MLYLILLLIALELINIHMVLGKNASEYQQYLRSVCNSSEHQRYLSQCAQFRTPSVPESVCNTSEYQQYLR